MWHTLSSQDIFEKFETSEAGLDNVKIKNQIEKFGLNVLPKGKQKSWIELFFRQFQSSIIYILFLAAIIVFFTGEIVDSLIILAVLVVNSIVGMIQEGRAQNTLTAITHLATSNATVLRNGNEIVIPSEELVPGDILVLGEGDKISADARIIECSNLKVDEASLTGESEAVMKNNEILSGVDLPKAEQKNMLFNGTYIVEGAGKAVIVTTGIHTVLGEMSVKLTDLDTDMPLKKSIESLSKFIIIAVLGICVLIFFVGLLKGISVKEMFAASVAIAVSAIPEGLPVVVTVVLAAGMYRMSKRNALVKKLQAVEALGQAEVIAVDKTGTVTFNQMMVEKIYCSDMFFDVSGRGYEPKGEITQNGLSVSYVDRPDILHLGKIASLTATAKVVYSEKDQDWKRVSGDPTEAALTVFAQKIGFHREELERNHNKLVEVPFSSHTKYHALLYGTDKARELFVAGAPEVIIEHLHHSRKKELEDVVAQMSREGLRVLALAMKEEVGGKIDIEEIRGLTLVGFVGISDSIRPEVHDAVIQAREAGVRVVMITGDHLETAKAIALKAKIYKEGDEVITGKQIQNMSATALGNSLSNVTVFARVAPEDKLKIIQAYRKRGEIIAMTGDGVNDALSLVAADLGVAMGKMGTEVAKQSADIVLVDDNFGSIVSAIEEGRNIYRTIQKVILYLFSTSLGEIMAILGAILVSYPLPVVASQIIWLNFITDGFLVVALALEPKEDELLNPKALKEEKRWMMNPLMITRMVLMSTVMMLGTLVLFHLYYGEGYEKATTVALTVLAVFQWFNAWNCKSATRSVFSRDMFANLWLLLALFIVVLLQFLAIYTAPLQKILHTVPLNLNDWLIIVSISLSIIVVEEVRKGFMRVK
jgi:P-type Ca2+ transporter type 2C